MKGTVLATGCAGFIGSHVVSALLEEGYGVVGVDNLTTGKRENMSEWADRVTFVEADITDAETMCKLCEGVDFIIHHAALTSVRESVDMPRNYNRVNVDGTINLLDAARRAGARRFVLASSSSVYGECREFPQAETILPTPASPYAFTKLGGEHYCRMYSELFGLETVALRYFNVYGPRQDPSSPYAAVIPIFAAKLLARESPTIFGTGEQTRDFVYVKDVCRANLAALAAPPSASGCVFNVAGGESISVNRLYRLIAKQVGAEDIDPVYADPQPGDVTRTLGSTALCRERLGFEPRTPLEEGLRQTMDSLAGEL